MDALIAALATLEASEGVRGMEEVSLRAGQMIVTVAQALEKQSTVPG